MSPAEFSRGFRCLEFWWVVVSGLDGWTLAELDGFTLRPLEVEASH